MAQATTDAVADDTRMENARQKIAETRSALANKLASIQERVVHTAQAVRSTVEQTLHDAKQTVHDGVQSVKNTFDLKQQATRHPWPMIGGALFAGVVLANWTRGRRTPGNGNPGNGHHGGATRLETRPVSSAMESRTCASACTEIKEYVQVRFKDELHKIQAVAVAAGAGLFRDWLRRTVPALAARLEKEFDGFRLEAGTASGSSPQATA